MGCLGKRKQALHNRKTTPTYIPSLSKQLPALLRLTDGVKFTDLQKTNTASQSAPAEEMAGF